MVVDVQWGAMVGLACCRALFGFWMFVILPCEAGEVAGCVSSLMEGRIGRGLWIGPSTTSWSPSPFAWGGEGKKPPVKQHILASKRRCAGYLGGINAKMWRKACKLSRNVTRQMWPSQVQPAIRGHRVRDSWTAGINEASCGSPV